MRALLCREFGAWSTLRVEDVPPPAMIEGGVRIRVRAAGVGFAAALVVAGKHQTRPPLPFSPGTEVAGEVLECAPGVTALQPGLRVSANVRWGGMAEQVVTPQHAVNPLPEGLAFPEATWFTTSYGTAYGALKWRAALGPDEWLLVFGAAGATGMAAVQIGKALGARVIAVASSPGKLAACRAAGADEALNSAGEDVRQRVLDLTGGAGVGAAFDPVGGSAFETALRCIRSEGRIVVIGFAGGTIPSIPANQLLVKNISVHGFYWGHYLGWGRTPPPPDTPENLRAAFAEMFRWYAQGRLRPLISGRYPLHEFQPAMAELLERRVIGKVVLMV